MIYKVLIADGLSPQGISKLKECSQVEILDKNGISREDLKQALKDVDILVVRSRTEVDRDLIENSHSLKLIIRAGIGLDNIDVQAATDRAIVVMNAPTGNIVTTAEHTLAMIFAISRRIAAADASLRQGRWEKKLFQGNELRGKTLGILGLGNIGRIVANRAQALGMDILVTDPYLSEEGAKKSNVRLVPFDRLLKQSDYLTLHVPLNDKTRHLIGEKELREMKPSAYVINCARGGIIDEVALVNALKDKIIAGAALDVFETEPLPKDHPLLKLPQAVLTPHLGASTDEAQTQVGIEVAEQITEYCTNGSLKNAVNVPNISLEELNTMRPFVNLCEKLGLFLGQIAPQRVTQLKICFEGSLASLSPREILTLSVLKGFLTPLMSTAVNFVNARQIHKERGSRIEVSVDEQCADYTGLVRVTVVGEYSISCAGTLFGKEEARIIRIDDFGIEAVPEGCLLFTRNSDEPGIIGKMGTVLGNAGVNIARMHLGLDRKKHEAIALINIDSKVPNQVLNELKSTKGMVFVHQIQL